MTDHLTENARLRAALIDARARHVAAVTAYNDKRDLVNKLRMVDDWSQNTVAEFAAMADAQQYFVKAAQAYADAALATPAALRAIAGDQP